MSLLARIPDDDDTAALGAALLVSPVRRAIVDALSNRPLARVDGDESKSGMTATQLAALLDLHVTTVRFHLDQLVAGGLLTAEFKRGHGVGRPRKVYSVAPGSLDQGSHEHALRILTELLAEAFGDGNVTPADAGATGLARTSPPIPGLPQTPLARGWARSPR